MQSDLSISLPINSVLVPFLYPGRRLSLSLSLRHICISSCTSGVTAGQWIIGPFSCASWLVWEHTTGGCLVRELFGGISDWLQQAVPLCVQCNIHSCITHTCGTIQLASALQSNLFIALAHSLFTLMDTFGSASLNHQYSSTTAWHSPSVGPIVCPAWTMSEIVDSASSRWQVLQGDHSRVNACQHNGRILSSYETCLLFPGRREDLHMRFCEHIRHERVCQLQLLFEHRMRCRLYF